MVTRISDEEMKATTASARALKNEASKGIGTPLERRIADALLENANNMDAHASSMNELLETSKETLAIASQMLDRANIALYQAEKCIERAELFGNMCVDAVRDGSEAAVKETSACALASMKDELGETAKEAKEAIKKADEAAREWKYRADRQGWFHSLTTVGKIVAIACVLFCTLACIISGWRAIALW